MGALVRMRRPTEREKVKANLKFQMRRLNKLPKDVASYFDSQFVSYAKAA